MRAASGTPVSIACLALAAALACVGPGSDPDAVAAAEEYRRLLDEARASIEVWGTAGSVEADPRPGWADRLEAFTRAHPRAPEAAEALEGAMKLRAARQDAAGFLADYELMLAIAPDAPQLAGLLEPLGLMRLVEEGGYGIAEASDPLARGLAHRRAAPRIAADLEKAVAASHNPSTLAAAHYRIGLIWHESGLSPRSALRHFQALVEKFPDSPLAASSRDYARTIEALAPGRPAPNFAATSLDGRKVSVSSLRGRPILLDFRAAWCDPCSDALPELQRIHRRHTGSGLVVVSVGLDADAEGMRRLAAQRRIAWPVVAFGQGMKDPVARAYSVQSLPMWYLIDRGGRIHGSVVDAYDLELEVDLLLRR